MRTKKGHGAKGTVGPDKKKTPDHDGRGPVTLTKMCRGYSMKVRGEIPDDIVERISGLHSAALRATDRPQKPPAESTDSSKDEGD